MKKLLLSFCLIAIANNNTEAQSCCAKPSDMKGWAMTKEFRESHESPAPFHFASDKGSMVEFNTLDGKKGHAYYVPSDQPTTKVLVIFHEWWGLNDYIKREAVRWQGLLGNVDVYAVDLYDGQVTDDPKRAGELAGGLDAKRGENIVKGVLSLIGNDKLVGTIGWCMGGSWSFTAAVDAGNRAAGCVMYYGFPTKDDKKIAALRTDILYIWGSQDKFITKDLVDDFGAKVKANKHVFDFHQYDAVHAFANPSNPKYNAVYTAEAQDLAVKFLKAKMALD